MASSSDKKYVADNEKLMAEWNCDKNNELGLNPKELTCGSGKKAWWICEKGHEWEAKVANRKNGKKKCPYCTNRKLLIGYNDLLSVNPELAKQWHPIKNGDLNPEDVIYGSNKRVWWLCEDGHEWEDSVSHRNNGDGCPYCSNHKILVGYNDLETTNPELAKQWHPTKNGCLTTQDVASGSSKKAWWICDKGHEWEATISSRSNGHGCPYCSGRNAIVGVNDLATINPELAKEWHKTKNKNLTPKDVTSKSGKKIWWMCNKGHEWEATISKRSNGRGCPYCAKEHHTSFAEQAIFFYCKKVTKAINRCIEFGKEIDIYLPEYKIGIEYNGRYWHKDNEYRDGNKVKYFADKGIRIITVKEGQRNFIDGDIIEHIYHQTDKTHLNFVIKNIFNIIGIKSEEPDINRDMNKIFEQYIESEKENSIAVKYPKSIIEWNYEKNGGFLPMMVSYGSQKKVWWKCEKCGYEWESRVSHYANGHWCPECSKKKRSKQVRCIETGVVYYSIREAGKQINIDHAGIISACKDKTRIAGGYHWEYVV